MPIDRETLANRLRHLRKTLGMSQVELAKQANLPGQNTLSFLESKHQFSMDVFITLVNFYSHHFYMDNIMCDNFTVQRLDDEIEHRNINNAITSKQLDILKEDMVERIEAIKTSLGEAEEGF